MPFLQRGIVFCFGCLSLFSRTAWSAPASPALSILPNAGSGDPTLGLHSPVNGSTLCGLGSSSSSRHGALGWDKQTWRISETLSLALTICNWEPDPATIQAVLAAAAVTAGKKPTTTLLEKKFTQRSNNKYNTLYFEISAGFIYRRLCWGGLG